jgi:hypothetical protein
MCARTRERTCKLWLWDESHPTMSVLRSRVSQFNCLVLRIRQSFFVRDHQYPTHLLPSLSLHLDCNRHRNLHLNEHFHPLSASIHRRNRRNHHRSGNCRSHSRGINIHSRSSTTRSTGPAPPITTENVIGANVVCTLPGAERIFQY